MSLSTLEVLRGARALIDTPEKWWDGSSGTDTPGCRRVCAWLAFPTIGAEHAEDALARAMGVPAPNSIPSFNDTHTHAEVLAAFDRAIAAEEARAQEFTVDVLPEPVAA